MALIWKIIETLVLLIIIFIYASAIWCYIQACKNCVKKELVTLITGLSIFRPEIFNETGNIYRIRFIKLWITLITIWIVVIILKT